ncbi:VIR protein [Plasmodium vivax]|uniref:VIR protein n=1 Tax=Plasmodium vivax TaxID=5855 RepID=A0A1G4HI21_PLAVI|nr:VIR protein [Plasmodium vivax]
MECIMSQKEADYEFFNSINSYTSSTHVAHGSPVRGDSSTHCDSFITSGILINDQDAKKVCEQFYNLYNLLVYNKNTMSAFLNNEDCGFLNYWLNEKLRNTNVNKHYCVNKFYDILKKKVITSINIDILNDKIYQIDNKELEKIKILLNLYKNFEIIHKLRMGNIEHYDKSCLQIYKECVKNYERVILKCPNKNTNFCVALDKYRKMYESLYSLKDKTDKCKANELIKLPGYDEVLKKVQMKTTLPITISFSLILLILLSIYLYKFTPLGSCICNNKNKKKEIKNTINRETHGFLKGNENNSININSGPYNVRYHS